MTAPVPATAPLELRIFAFCFDVCVRLLPFVCVGAIGWIGDVAWATRWAGPTLLCTLIITTLLDLYGLARSGQTLGRRLFRIAIRRSSGRAVRAFRILLLRTLIPWALVLTPYLGLLWLALDHLWVLGADRRAVRDWIADTLVVRVPEPERG